MVYRKVNDLTKKKAICVDDTLDVLGGQKCLNSLDLRSGYWQIPREPEDAEKAAFTIQRNALWNVTLQQRFIGQWRRCWLVRSALLV